MVSDPVFLLTMGDPAGIGPEISIKALASSKLSMNVVIIGDLKVLQYTAEKLGMSVCFHSIEKFSDFKRNAINVLDCSIIRPDQFETGKAQKNCGEASYKYILKAIQLVLKKEAAAVTTNPINKESLKMAGINYPGHTEIFAAETGCNKFSMMFYLDHIGVAHVTTHCSLRKAIDLITKDRIMNHIRLLNSAMKQLGVKKPRIAVGGLNPHAGENGLFGDEEIKHISPAISDARKEGINASGPYPPDTVFMRAFKGEFDGIVSMIHDHGFVALKSRNFQNGVNITIGLPIIRTSVGHGTAYDIAGKGIASPQSLITALNAAHTIYLNRTRND